MWTGKEMASATSPEKSLEEQSLQARWLQIPGTFVEKIAEQ
jgi:hypothetical protein